MAGEGEGVVSGMAATDTGAEAGADGATGVGAGRSEEEESKAVVGTGAESRTGVHPADARGSDVQGGKILQGMGGESDAGEECYHSESAESDEEDEADASDSEYDELDQASGCICNIYSRYAHHIHAQREGESESEEKRRSCVYVCCHTLSITDIFYLDLTENLPLHTHILTSTYIHTHFYTHRWGIQNKQKRRPTSQACFLFRGNRRNR